MRKLVGLVMLLAACGDDSPVRHLDGGTDAPLESDAPLPMAVTLTVTSGGSPQSGIKVYFQGSDSSLISNTMTDGSGVASAIMPNGGFVTALDPTGALGGGTFHVVYTFAGVKSGDHLFIKDDFSSSVDVTVTAPVDGTSGVTSYLFSTPCDNTTIVAPGSAAQPQATLSLDGPCATTSDFLVASLDDVGQVINWFYVPNKAVTAAVDLTASTYAAATAKSYTFNNASVFGSFNIDQLFVSPRGRVVTLPGGAFGKGSPFTGTINATPFTAALDVVDASASAGATEHHLLDWGPFSSTYTTDVGARLLPEFDLPAIDITAHAVGWTESAPGVTPDFALAVLSAQRTGLGFVWNIAAPYSGATIAMPTLPTDVADFTITETDSTEFFGVALGKVPGGYDAVRANVFNANGPEAFAVGASGSMTIEVWNMPRLARELPRSNPRLPGFVSGIIGDRSRHPHWRK